MQRYELTYLISDEILEEEVKSLQNKITSLIQEEGGILYKENVFLRRKLAYPIKGRTQAYLTVSDFQLNPEKLVDFEKKLKETAQIIRYLILIKKSPRPMKISSRVRKPKEVTEEKKVELKEIEQKLEEILNEPQ